MSTKKALSTEIQLSILKAKRDTYVEKIESLLGFCDNLDSIENVDEFFAEFYTLDSTMKQLELVVNEYNLVAASDEESFKPDFSLLTWADKAYGKIKKFHNDLSLKKKKVEILSQNSDIKYKLPKINLVEFSGNPKDWPWFFETFKTLIHENSSLNNISKFHYLVGALKGKALEMCAGITPSADNYEVFWSMLVNRFHDKRSLAHSYWQNIINFKTLKDNSSSSLSLFLEKFDVNVNSLLQLNIPDLGDFLLTALAISKLDSTLQREFENNWQGSDIPKYKDLISFVNTQAKAARRVDNNKSTFEINKIKFGYKSNFSKTSQTFATTSTPFLGDSETNLKVLKSSDRCCVCKKDHFIAKCKEFLKFKTFERYNIVKENNLCLVCLNLGHHVLTCKSLKNCRICNKRHNTLLHFEKQINSKENEIKEQRPEVETKENKKVQNFCAIEKIEESKSCPSTVLLATVVVWIEGNGVRRKGRFLIDSASQSNFLTEKLCKELHLEIRPSSTVVSGLGQHHQSSRGEVSFAVVSRFNETSRFSVSALVVPKITDNLPSVQLIADSLDYLRCLRLADDTLENEAPVDGILGAQFVPFVWGTNKVKGPRNYPIAVESCFGYIVMGQIPEFKFNSNSNRLMNNSQTFCSFSNENLDETLKRFWLVEEVPETSTLSKEDLQTEDNFKNTIFREASGRYVTTLPFKENPCVLGSSSEAALRRFLNLEKRLRYSPQLREQYDAAIKDLLDQGHMIEDKENSTNLGYIIPHHAVIKEESVSTKIRIVFDASCRTSSGKSLNDILFVGPKLYSDLYQILLNFRLFPVAITADIKQMYRMIKIREDHQSFQKLFWRWAPDQPIKTYKLTTVVFGVASSPFLALRTIKQLIEDENLNYPEACNIALNSLYMDDLATSILEPNEAIKISLDLIKLFQSGGFNLTKWSSNCKNLIDNIPEASRLSTIVDFEHDNSLKILGLRWDSINDNFFFKINYTSKNCTKRNILSTVARIFDPLGLLTPIIFWLKILIKELWLCKLDWDTVAPKNILKLWNCFENEINLIENFKINRHLGIVKNCKVVLIGFSDASEKGYGAVVYSRVITDSGIVTCELVCGKSKVSPVKSLSIPRLELCGAYLLSKLMKFILETCRSKVEIKNYYCCTDSTVVLNWIKGPASKWKPFVSNRVGKIQENVGFDNWYHVKGVENPADLASRGCLPSNLQDCSFWWQGPSWLLEEENLWPLAGEIIDTDLEKKVSTVLVVEKLKINDWVELFDRCSSWKKLLKIFVYILRFIKKLPRDNLIKIEDFEEAEKVILSLVQKQYFSQEIENLSKGKDCSKQLIKLSPIISEGFLRVGGRLKHSSLTLDQKHPILLPSNSRVTELIVDHFHKINLHTSSYILISLLRQKYWILGIRNLVKKQIRNCNLCFKAKPKNFFPLMADLPKCRVEKTKAFLHVGVDMAGPILITLSKHRGVKSQKAYIALFVCLVTKAIHLELVSELSTQAFILAFRRFVVRRGPCEVFYSDRGTNFIGIRNKLEDSYKFFESKEFQLVWGNSLLEHKIKWKVNPPSAPHFGGIWESNIKCVKSHLVKLVNNSLLSFEEFYTVLVQIEGILNSRPLYTLSDDPNDPSALTPSHFLNLVPVSHVPLRDDFDFAKKAITRFQLISQLVSSFWNRWRLEYLHNLQVRNKWVKNLPSIKEGTVVLLSIDNVLPMEWPLGIVTKVFPGSNGIVRVVEVKTKQGTYTRPVVKLYPLPSQ